MKYRIIGSRNEKREEYPYTLQRQHTLIFGIKYFISITMHSNIKDAERAMHEDIKLQKRLPEPGEIIKVYTEEDLIVDKLKGTVA